MVRKCSVCKKEKPLDQFSKKKKGYQCYCKTCHSYYRKQHYLKNKNKIITQIEERQRSLQIYLSDYKTQKACKECGENHPACLDLHHRNASEKLITPSNMWRQGWSIERMHSELDKCDVLCSNCHRKQHWRRGSAALFQSAGEIS